MLVFGEHDRKDKLWISIRHWLKNSDLNRSR